MKFIDLDLLLRTPQSQPRMSGIGAWVLTEARTVAGQSLAALLLLGNLVYAANNSESGSLSQRTKLVQLTEIPNASISQLAEIPSDPVTSSEHWVGWIEGPNSHQRWHLELSKNQDGSIGGTSRTPDLSSRPVQLREGEKSGNNLHIQWIDAASQQLVSYAAEIVSNKQMSGLFLMGDQSLPVHMSRVDSFPDEDAKKLGADIVWTDQLPTPPNIAEVHRFDMRFRFYTSPPYADARPKILFDSVANGLFGLPVDFSQTAEGSFVFKIPGIEAEYRAELDGSSEKLVGQFLRKGKSEEVVMRLLPEDGELRPESEPSSPSDDKSADSDSEMAGLTPPERMKRVEPRSTLVESPLDHGLLANEQAFVLTLADSDRGTGSSHARSSKNSTSRQTQRRSIGLTITQPTNETLDEESDGENLATHPAVVILPTYGVYDRDGRPSHENGPSTRAPYRVLSQWLAEQGISSVRFDAPGVGESTSLEGLLTYEQAIADAVQLLDLLKTHPNVDADRVGILGHGQGADVAAQVASLYPNLPFVIAIAPRGVNGSDFLIARMQEAAQLDQVPAATQHTLMSLQKCVHQVASTDSGDLDSQLKKLKTALTEHWPVIAKDMRQSKSADELTALRKGLEAQLAADVMMLDTPWNRTFLTDSPTTSWMLVQSPSLVIWGDADREVPPKWNAPEIQTAITRNSSSRIVSKTIPQLSHWLETSQSAGSTDANSASPQNDREFVLSPELADALSEWLQMEVTY